MMWRHALGVLVAVGLSATTASADTGGSMGGGSWGNSNGHSGGGSWSSSGSSRSSWGSSRKSSSGLTTPSWSSSRGWSSSPSRTFGSGRTPSTPALPASSDDGDSSAGANDSSAGVGATSEDWTPSLRPDRGFDQDDFPFIMAALVVLGVGVVLVLGRLEDHLGGRRERAAMHAELATTDVTVLRVAIDGRARRFVQRELASIAASAETATPAGRAAMLRMVAIMLRHLRDAWVYGGASNHPLRTIGAAKLAFDQEVDHARSRFVEELVRNSDGVIQERQTSEYRPRGDEGDGLVLISIILAAHHELFTVTEIRNGDQLRRALQSASEISEDALIAAEIVWQPALDSDRLTSMELEAKYPRPAILPIEGALVGKAFCLYCSGPFPAELVSCPHCGAPAPGRELAQAA